jgi:DNA-binding NtrC family response regulator
MCKVLIVDDEPAYRTLLSQLLDGRGCDTRTANGAHSAIDVASEFRPQVVIADWMLRDFHDGLDLVFALRHAGITCPVILMSGYPSDQLVADALAGGIYRFFPKPFEPEDIVAAVLAAKG